MDETSEFINGLKILEEKTGLTITGTAYNRLYIVPIDNVSPYPEIIKATLTAERHKGIREIEG